MSLRFAARTVLIIGLTLVTLPAAAGPVELHGRYDWNITDERGDLRVTFAPTGDRTWDVVFDFNHFGTDHTYRGTAVGSLSSGELTGEIMNEKRDRTFTFEGTTTDGQFRGTHAETTDGANRLGGGLVMGPAK